MQIITHPDQRLRQKSIEVDLGKENVGEIVAEMQEMLAARDGAGLAAPQVGILKRIFIAQQKNGEEWSTHVFVNPKIVWESEEMAIFEEGCLSVVDKSGKTVFADVERVSAIDVEWMDENGKKKIAELDDINARIFQHELDHLDGVLFIDYLTVAERGELNLPKK